MFSLTTSEVPPFAPGCAVAAVVGLFNWFEVPPYAQSLRNTCDGEVSADDAFQRPAYS